MNEGGGFGRRGASGASDFDRSGAGERGGDVNERGGFKRRGAAGSRGDSDREDSGERGFKRGGERGYDRRSDSGERGGFARGGDDGADRRRGGEGARGGRSLDRRPPRPEEPDLPDDVQATELDMAVRRDLLSLDKSNAETVARHLVMAARLIDDDPGLALAHARAARQRAGRIAVVRETAGVTAYHAGEWAEALSELRTARRMSGGSGLLAVMADCERGLGRPERAIELGRSDEARALRGDEAIELRIVVAGARMDMGQYDQAVVTLQTPDLDPARTGSAHARLFYAYADALVAAGRTDEGLTWFLNAASADLDSETDAEERAAELTGETYELGDDYQ
ncbi:tetratricopeptide repeat protein [Nocardia arthritidis]|uniref:tetratricopeptide repeat protein n=1 Tax=Nocardia arthritidis TaxID=228602 RepID=UPI003D16211A